MTILKSIFAATVFAAVATAAVANPAPTAPAAPAAKAPAAQAAAKTPAAADAQLQAQCDKEAKEGKAVTANCAELKKKEEAAKVEVKGEEKAEAKTEGKAPEAPKAAEKK